MSTMKKLTFFLFRGEQMGTLLQVPEYMYRLFYRWNVFYRVRDFLFIQN